MSSYFCKYFNIESICFVNFIFNFLLLKYEHYEVMLTTMDTDYIIISLYTKFTLSPYLHRLLAYHPVAGTTKPPKCTSASIASAEAITCCM